MVAYVLSRAVSFTVVLLATDTVVPLSESLCRWDCSWYQTVAERGYDALPGLRAVQPGTANWAFFPVFPLLVSAWTYLTSMGFALSAVLLNNALGMAAALLLYGYASDRIGAHVALPASLCFVFSPFSFYLSVPYTEALFNALSVAALWLCFNRH